jgi:hypothetical protein
MVRLITYGLILFILNSQLVLALGQARSDRFLVLRRLI